MSRGVRAALLLGAIVALALAARFLPLARLLGELRASIEGLGALGPLLFMAVYTISVVLVLPCFLLGMLSGTLVYVTLGHLGRTGLEGAVARTPSEKALVALGALASLVLAVLLTRLARQALAPPPESPTERSDERSTGSA